jgi:hypothetical protein
MKKKKNLRKIKKEGILIDDDSKKLLVFQYLSNKYKSGNLTCKSSYFALLSHARSATGRCCKNGSIDFIEKTGDWSGACMYLILIDHIGGRFRNKNKEIDSNLKDFGAALKSFTGLSKKKIEILRELRNSFLHKFNLYNFPEDKKFVCRLFSVNRGEEFIRLPMKNLEDSEKSLSKIEDGNKTCVSLKKLGDLVENMHKKLLSLLNSGDLIVVTENSDNLEDFLNANTICYEEKYF